LRESWNVDGDALRWVMRLYPSGVSVLTVDADGDRIGVTIGSLVSLSLEPALVGVSIGRELAVHELLRRAGAFAVSLLRGDQGQVAAQFARGAPPIALWAGVETRTGATGAPLLVDALAWLECRVAAEHRVGDHTFFVGEVVAIDEGETGSALAYREHRYLSVD
jgi:flavin reductase (DIM6/NTAB) family NADH-FMN oxidoreductase RutF